MTLLWEGIHCRKSCYCSNEVGIQLQWTGYNRMRNVAAAGRVFLIFMISCTQITPLFILITYQLTIY